MHAYVSLVIGLLAFVFPWTWGIFFTDGEMWDGVHGDDLHEYWKEKREMAINGTHPRSGSGALPKDVIDFIKEPSAFERHEQRRADDAENVAHFMIRMVISSCTAK